MVIFRLEEAPEDDLIPWPKELLLECNTSLWGNALCPSGSDSVAEVSGVEYSWDTQNGPEPPVATALLGIPVPADKT